MGGWLAVSRCRWVGGCGGWLAVACCRWVGGCVSLLAGMHRVVAGGWVWTIDVTHQTDQQPETPHHPQALLTRPIHQPTKTNRKTGTAHSPTPPPPPAKPIIQVTNQCHVTHPTKPKHPEKQALRAKGLERVTERVGRLPIAPEYKARVYMHAHMTPSP